VKALNERSILTGALVVLHTPPHLTTHHGI